MTEEEQKQTVAMADYILAAPQTELDQEPPDCLLEILDVVCAALNKIHLVGIGFRVVRLEILKAKIEKKMEELAFDT